MKSCFNKPDPLNPPAIEAVHTDLLKDVTTPTIEEISKFVRQIKDGESAG